MPKRGGTLKRKTGTRAPKPKFIIFCEGKNTEPQYLAAFRTRFPRTLFEIELVRAAGVPDTLLRKAIDRQRYLRRAAKHGKSYAEDDEVWIAFDRDEHPKVKQTIHNARQNGVGVAYSNPCFELWLILHREDYERPASRHDVQKYCEKSVEGYSRDSGKSGNFLALLDGLEDAESRAEKQRERRTKEGAEEEAPWTTFSELTKALRKT